MSGGITEQDLASFFPPGFSIYGGLPLSIDIGPTALFIALYALLLPLAFWRFYKKESRAVSFLWRVAFFVQVRIATYGIRMAEALGHYSANLFIAELVLILSGFSIICEPIVHLLEQHLHASAFRANVQQPPLILKLLKMMRLGLLASLILGIYMSTQYQSVIENPSKLSQFDQYRLAVAGLNLGILSATVVLAVVLHKPYQMNGKGTGFIVTTGLFLVACSAYRMAAVKHYQPLLSTRSKVYFYIFSCGFEWIATALFFSINLNNAFDLQYKVPGSGGPIGSLITRIRGTDVQQNQVHQQTAYANQPNHGWGEK